MSNENDPIVSYLRIKPLQLLQQLQQVVLKVKCILELPSVLNLANPANHANPFLTNLFKKPFLTIFANVVPNKITAVHGYVNAVG